MTKTEDGHKNVHLTLVAGEPSGDVLGGQVMAELKAKSHHAISFTGVGGGHMQSQGLKSLFPMDEISLMGINQIIGKLPKLLRYMNQVVAHVLETRPDAIILIDSSGFNHPIAKRLKKRGYQGKIIKYVAPQVWASRPWRARSMARYIDHVLTLFPFEPEYFTKEGMGATFVGHPIAERPYQFGKGPAFRADHHIPEDAPLLCLLPGSRRSELKHMTPCFLEAVMLLHQKLPNLQLVVPTTERLKDEVTQRFAAVPLHSVIVSDEIDKFAAFDAANAALAASGSVSLELALAKTPMVIGYKVEALTAFIFKRLIYAPYITLVNILLNREAVPEFTQDDCVPDRLCKALYPLFADEERRNSQLARFEDVRTQLVRDDTSAADSTAQAILAIIES